MISVILWCRGRQEMLDHTLPKWLGQTGVDYEIVIGCGQGVSVFPNPRVFTVDCGNDGLCKSVNRVIRASKGDLLLLADCDMEVNSPTQLARMLAAWAPHKMVTEKFFRDGKRDMGLFRQFMLVSKAAVLSVGGYCELYDDPTMYGFEDSELVCALFESGLRYEIMETPEDEAVYHVDHPRMDITDPIVKARLDKAKALFDSRHAKGPMHNLLTQKFESMSTARKL